MPQYVNDSALCLRVHDYSETSQIVGLLTCHHGLIPVIAKGVKRPQPKSHPGPISGPLDLLTSGEVVLIPAKGSSELGTLTAWSITDHRPLIRKDLAALQTAMLAADMTQLMLQPGDPHEGLYDELMATLDLVVTPLRPRAILAYAKTLLAAAGYAPQFEACVSCGTLLAADQDVRFASAMGGLICRDCPPSGSVAIIPGRIARALARLQTPTALRAAPPEKPADPAALSTALKILLNQIEFISGRGLRTRAMCEV